MPRGPQDRVAVAAKPAVVARGGRPGRTEGDRAGQSADTVDFQVAATWRRRPAARGRDRRPGPRSRRRAVLAQGAPAVQGGRHRHRGTASRRPAAAEGDRCHWSLARTTRLSRHRARSPRKSFTRSRQRPSRATGPMKRRACAVYVDPPPRVLLVESQPVLAEHLKKALAGENVEVEVRPELPAGERLPPTT